MGVRGELFSTKVTLQNRTYFFNVKENRLGDLYLNIVESKNREEGGFERQSLILFAEDLQDFLQGFDESLKILEKAEREKRRGGKGGSSGERSFRSERSDRDRPSRERSYDKSFDKPFRDRRSGAPTGGTLSGIRRSREGRDSNDSKASRPGRKGDDSSFGKSRPRRSENSFSKPGRKSSANKQGPANRKRVVVRKKR